MCKWSCYITGSCQQGKPSVKRKKVDAMVDAVNIKSLDRDIKDCVAYISITKTVKEYPVPVINGIAFLTGVRQEDELKKLIDAVNKS
jgi:PTS system galactitol-specific IIB component